QDAYDAIQETYTRVYKNLSRLENVSSFYPWLHRIAENCSLDILKQNGQDISVDDLKENAATRDKAPQSDVTSDVTEVLKQLEPEQMEIIYHVYYDGMQVTQIARMQGIPKTTVYNRLKAAKKRLKDLLRVRGIDKPIYGGEFVSLISTALRNAIGTQLLSMAIAEEILHSVTGSKNVKGAFVLSRFARNMRNTAAKKIASIILLVCLLLFLVGFLIFTTFYNLFGKDGALSINLGGMFDWVGVFDGSDDDKNDSDSFDGTTASKPLTDDSSSDKASTSSASSASTSTSSSGSSSVTTSSSTSAYTVTSSDTSASSSASTSSQTSTAKPSSSPSSSTLTSKPSTSSTTSSGTRQPVEVTYVIRGGGAYLTGITGNLNDEGYLSVPWTVEDYGDSIESTPGYPIVGIDSLNGCENVKELWLPETIEDINPYAFDTCRQLEEIAFFSNNPVYSTAGNCLIDKSSKTLKRGFKSSVIPTDGSVTSIGYYAFSGCEGLTSITVPNTIKSIGELAFADCTGLKSLTIPDSVLYHGGNGTFIGCTSLEYVKIGSGLTYLTDMSSFEGCTSLKTVVLSEGLKSIGGWSFADCTSLTSITLPSTLEGIAADAFENCKNLKHVYYGGSSSVRSKIDIDSGNTALTSATW
ncbi:MAG: sigma-70 family RNA polymerase sigma factor, partial [Clostridia bacterium]|nr:sigma-70 family RNA polymerase sigma factor [Clostridia bacterium]